MPLYMYQASYTAKSMAAQLKEPQDPVEAIRPALEDLGAEIVVAGFPFGEYDLLVVYEAPDDMTAASVAMAVAAAGEVKSAKTTRLLSGAGMARVAAQTPGRQHAECALATLAAARVSGRDGAGRAAAPHPGSR